MKRNTSTRSISAGHPATRVLLIDSGLHNNETIQAMLESHGLVVQLIKIIGKEPEPETYEAVDIIIIDTGNSTTDVYRRCALIRQSSHTPLLVLSTLNQPAVIANMLDCGADDFVTKPVSPEVLVARINTLTRRARSSKSN